MIRLSDLRPGLSGRIVRIEGQRAYRRRLMEMGLLPGTEVSILRSGRIGGLIDLQARRSRLCVRESEARELWVQPT